MPVVKLNLERHDYLEIPLYFAIVAVYKTVALFGLTEHLTLVRLTEGHFYLEKDFCLLYSGISIAI